jgi:zinc and cadmium transporter
MIAFFVVEKLLRHYHRMLREPDDRDQMRHPELAAINVLGDAIHNFIDGVLIGASYLAGPTIGISTTMAVLFHEIPQEFGDFSILVHSGLSVRKAVFLNLASAGAALLGNVIALLTGAMVGSTVVSTLLPATAGGFVYLAAADLIPEMQRDRSLRALLVQTSLMSIGMGFMALLTIIE